MCKYVYILVINMVNITISLPSDLKELLDRHPEMNWSEVARQAWKQKAEQLEFLSKLTSGSKANEKDIDELGKLLKKGIAQWHDEAARKTKMKA